MEMAVNILELWRTNLFTCFVRRVLDSMIVKVVLLFELLFFVIVDFV